jgi:hypothetical protein
MRRGIWIDEHTYSANEPEPPAGGYGHPDTVPMLTAAQIRKSLRQSAKGAEELRKTLDRDMVPTPQQMSLVLK